MLLMVTIGNNGSFFQGPPGREILSHNTYALQVNLILHLYEFLFAYMYEGFVQDLVHVLRVVGVIVVGVVGACPIPLQKMYSQLEHRMYLQILVLGTCTPMVYLW